MTRFGTGLSKALLVTLWGAIALVALAGLVGVGVGAVAAVEPAAFEGVRGQINGQPVQLRQPDQALGVAAVIVAASIYAGAILWQLLGMLRSTVARAPFTVGNVRRLRILAGLFAVGFLVQLGALLLPEAAQSLLNVQRIRLDLSTVLAALLALVLAEVFAEGVRLREESEGTI